MVGVTISFGGVVTAAAVSQFNLSAASSSIASGVQASSSGKQVSLVYGTVQSPGSGGCTSVYGGYAEGTAYSLALYNYGSVSFVPLQVFLNGTLLAGGPYAPISPGYSTTYSLTLPCAHPSGQLFLLLDSAGDEIQVAT